MSTIFASISTSKVGLRWRAQRKPLRSSAISCLAADRDKREGSNDAASVPAKTGAVDLADPDLSDLNTSLQILSEVFPDVHPDDIRTTLSRVTPESRLQIVTEYLLQNKLKLGPGRLSVDTTSGTRPCASARLGGNSLAVEDSFRSEQYKAAVRAALYDEFTGLSHSTVRAVLAENNFHYTRTRPTLLQLSSKSWKFALASLITRRRNPCAAENPFIIYDSGSDLPQLRLSGSEELNVELYETFIAPILAQRKKEQEVKDRQLAIQLNGAEAEAAEAMYDCDCCFTNNAFEHISTCGTGAHFICFSCIRHTVIESIYGQNWSRSVDSRNLSLHCIALATGNVNCDGRISPALSNEPCYRNQMD